MEPIYETGDLRHLKHTGPLNPLYYTDVSDLGVFAHLPWEYHPEDGNNGQCPDDPLMINVSIDGLGDPDSDDQNPPVFAISLVELIDQMFEGYSSSYPALTDLEIPANKVGPWLEIADALVVQADRIRELVRSAKIEPDDDNADAP